MAVVVIGNATVDLSYEVPRLPVPGETLLAGAKLVDAGGKGLNQAIVARRAGADVVFCAALGRDAQAAVALERLRCEGLSAGHLARLPVATDESLIFLARSGENTIVSTAAAAQNLAPEMVAAILDRLGPADLVLMQGNLTLETTSFCLRRARAAGACTLLNAAPIAFDYTRLWPEVDVAIVNQVESRVLTGNADPSAAARVLRQAGVGVVVTTLGHDGARMVDQAGECVAPAPDIEALDTTGAGDVFCGVLAAALASRMERAAALRWAVSAASLSVGRRGTASSFPTREELARLRGSALAGAGGR